MEQNSEGKQATGAAERAASENQLASRPASARDSAPATRARGGLAGNVESAPHPQSPTREAQIRALTTALAREVDCTDTGETDPELANALAKSPLSERVRESARVFARARLILPVFPHAPRADQTAPAPPALPGASAPPGTPASAADSCPPGALYCERIGTAGVETALVFSSVAKLNAALSGARPVPVNGRSLALAALSRPGRLLLDGEIYLPPSALLAIGAGDEWLPAWENTELEREVAARVGEVCAAEGMRAERVKIAPQQAGPDRLLLGISAASFDLLALQRLIGAICDALAGSERLRQQCDSLEITPIAI